MMTYDKLMLLPTYEDRINALIIYEEYESPRDISQKFYKSENWLSKREQILIRDSGFDLGVFGRYIYGTLYVHHIDPITPQDILEFNPKILDPNNLITVSDETHKRIHYGTPIDPYVERMEADTKLW